MHDRPYLARGRARGRGGDGRRGPRGARRRSRCRSACRCWPAPTARRSRSRIAVGAAFVRVEGFVFAHVADEGLIESDAGALLRYRRAIGAEGVRVFADVKKKHSAHAITADVDLAETAHAAEFFLADGVIVTGAATGEPPTRPRSAPLPRRSRSRCWWARASRRRTSPLRGRGRLHRRLLGEAGRRCGRTRSTPPGRRRCAAPSTRCPSADQGPAGYGCPARHSQWAAARSITNGTSSSSSSRSRRSASAASAIRPRYEARSG